jgi:ribosomal protein S16
MKQIAVSELQEKAADYLTGKEPLAIEHDGEVVGYYYPKKRTKQEELNRKLDRLLQSLAEVSGLTEDEIADFIDLSKPKKRTKQEEVERAVKQLRETVDRVLAETGMTEDELADLFDTSKPFPYDFDS